MKWDKIITDNFDKTNINKNYYISRIKEEGTDYLISLCESECKGCYSSPNMIAMNADWAIL